MLKVVLDTNILVSGTIVPKGNPYGVIKAWKEGQFLLVVTPQLIQEVIEVLMRPHIRRGYSLGDQQVSDVIQAIVEGGLMVPGRLEIAAVARDPDDDAILACAKEGKANYIVTGDKDLLDLDVFEGIPIVSARKFLSILRGIS